VLADFSREEIDMLVSMLKRMIDKLQDGETERQP